MEHWQIPSLFRWSQAFSEDCAWTGLCDSETSWHYKGVTMGLATNSKAIITKEKQQYITILINIYKHHCLGKLWETTTASMEVHRIHAQRGRRSWKPTLDSSESWRMSICLARLVQALKLESLEWNFEGLHTLRPLIWMLCIVCT